MIKNLINHIVFVLDASSSMLDDGKDKELVKFFDAEVSYLAKRSQELNQQTLVSVYTFADKAECLIYNVDVLRLPSIKDYYKPYGWTAMLDGLGQALEDVQKYTPPFAESQTSSLFYLLSDGMTNRDHVYTPAKMKQKLASLPDNFTVAVFVPDQTAAHECKSFGIPAGNIAIWDANTKKGVSEGGAKIRATTSTFMDARASGTFRGSKNLFQINTNVSATEVKKKLEALKANEYKVLIARKDKEPIKEFVESWIGQDTYVPGCAYYRLDKPEKVQAGKAVLVREVKTGKVFGGDDARKMFGLPDYEVKVEPAQLAGYELFIQSSSVNRNIFKDSTGRGNVIVLV